jgi:hypothetical protein
MPAEPIFVAFVDYVTRTQIDIQLDVTPSRRFGGTASEVFRDHRQCGGDVLAYGDAVLTAAGLRMI